MPQLAYKPFKGRTIRLTKLDGCCTPPPADTECAVAVFDSFTTVSIEANVEEGETAFEKKANGDVCINERDPDILQDLTVSLTLCQVQPEIVTMLTGWPIVLDAAGNGVGFDVMSGITEAEVAVEIWSGVAGISCGAGQRFGYNVLPCTSGWQIDGSIEWAGIDTIWSITLTATAKDNHAWGSGPYAVQMDSTGTPGALLDPMQLGSLARIMTTEVAPPAVTNGCVAASAANGYLYPPVPVTPWAATTAYAVGDRVSLTGGAVLEATVAGTSGATEPVAPASVGGTVVDGGVTWERVS